MEADKLSLEIVRQSSRQRLPLIDSSSTSLGCSVQLRIAASRGKLHEVRTLLANGTPVTKDQVSCSRTCYVIYGLP